MTTAERIDTILQERKMSRRKLASEAHVSPSTLQCALARGGNLSLDLLVPISGVLGVSVAYLSGADESPQARLDTIVERGRTSPVDDKIRHHLAGLNETGKLRALAAIEDLAEIPRYKKESD